MTTKVGRWSVLAMLSGLLVSSVAASGCNRADGRMDKAAKGSDTDGEEEEKPTPVVPAEVVRGSMLATISSASTIEAERQATIHAESTGRILSLKVEEGDKVKKGKQLARIKADAQANSVDRARKMLVQSQRDFDRAQKLYDSNVIGKEEYDRAKDAVDVAKLDVRDRNRDVRNTKIVAPFSGTITERMLIEGSF
ncbi:MAG: efflux RND transporter periplasmic adaptor subunit, partial [Nannocystaceae bacterium]